MTGTFRNSGWCTSTWRAHRRSCPSWRTFSRFWKKPAPRLCSWNTKTCSRSGARSETSRPETATPSRTFRPFWGGPHRTTCPSFRSSRPSATWSSFWSWRSSGTSGSRTRSRSPSVRAKMKAGTWSPRWSIKVGVNFFLLAPWRLFERKKAEDCARANFRRKNE